MHTPRTESLSEDESLSALSDVDESFLNDLQPESVDVKSTITSATAKVAKSGSVDSKDKTHGRTALHKACSKGNMDKIRDLLSKGATIDITDNAGVTPLHDACAQDHAPVVRHLLEHGAKVSPRDCEGDYPLLDAAQNDNLEICQLLLDAGANPTTQNSKGMSALSEAEEGPVKELLRSYSSRFESPGQNRMRIMDVLSADTKTEVAPTVLSPQRTSERIRPRSSQLNISSNGARKVDINGRDQLHQYVLEQDDDLVEQFLGIQECNYQDNYGNTPLHTAAREGNAHICGLLLQHKAVVNIWNNEGNTPLHEACYTRNNKDVIIALLDGGASSLWKNREGLTPSVIATSALGIDSVEARLLLKTQEKEVRKVAVKSRKRTAAERRGSGPLSGCSSPARSPGQVAADKPVPGRGQQKPRSESTASTATDTIVMAQKLSDVVQLSAANILKDHVETPPGNIPSQSRPPIESNASHMVDPTLKQWSSGVPITRFLSEYRATCALSHIDSSIRGSPLPPPLDQNDHTHSPILDHDSRNQSAVPGSGQARQYSPERLSRKRCRPMETKKSNHCSALENMPSSPQRARKKSPARVPARTSRIQENEHFDQSLSTLEDPIEQAITRMTSEVLEAINKQNTTIVELMNNIKDLIRTRRA